MKRAWWILTFAFAACGTPHDPAPQLIHEGTVDLAVVGDETCTITADTNIECVGETFRTGYDNNGNPIVIDVPPALHLALSDAHSCAAHVAGVTCWGFGDDGTVGDAVAVPGVTVVKTLAAGGANTCAIDGDDAVLCWNGDGVAIAEERDDGTPLTAQSLSMRGDRACAIDLAGAAWCWQALDPATLRDPGPLLSIAIGADHDCWVAAGGKVMCEGEDLNGESGDPATARHCTDRPCTVGPTVVDVPAAVSVAVGGRHSCAVTGDGALYCWGSNEYSQLGRDDVYLLGEPAQVRGLPAVQRAALGDDHSCARTAAGDVYCWGKTYAYYDDLHGGGVE